MNQNLAIALNLLDIKTKTQAQAFFNYLHLAGYLSDELINKAIDYLASSKPFALDKEKVKADLRSACQQTDTILDNFGKEDYFATDDIIDLITFLSQTAFDRKYGEERDKLKTKPWLEEHTEKFVALTT